MPLSSNPSPDTKKPVRRTLFHRMVNPSMEREVQANLRKMHNPLFSVIAHGMEARFPTNASFGKFRGNSPLPVETPKTDSVDPETAKGP